MRDTTYEFVVNWEHADNVRIEHVRKSVLYKRTREIPITLELTLLYESIMEQELK